MVNVPGLFLYPKSYGVRVWVRGEHGERYRPVQADPPRIVVHMEPEHRVSFVIRVFHHALRLIPSERHIPIAVFVQVEPVSAILAAVAEDTPVHVHGIEHVAESWRGQVYFTSRVAFDDVDDGIEA